MRVDKLTERQLEYLDILQEECAEVIAVVSKIKRFGLHNYNPLHPERTPNYERLESEIGDVLAMIQLVVQEDIGVDLKGLQAAKERKLNKLPQFLRTKDVRPE